MTDTLDEIICPACHKPMAKIYLTEQKFNVDVCMDGCGGIFLDNRELNKIDEIKDDITPLIEALKNREFQKVDENVKRICPVCGHTMVKNHESEKKEIIIDECYNCGGKFFDCSELFTYRNAYKTEEERELAFKKYSDSILKSIMGELDKKKTAASMIKGIIKDHRELNE